MPPFKSESGLDPKDELEINAQKFKKVGEIKSEENLDDKSHTQVAPKSYDLYQDTDTGALAGVLPEDHDAKVKSRQDEINLSEVNKKNAEEKDKIGAVAALKGELEITNEEKEKRRKDITKAFSSILPYTGDSWFNKVRFNLSRTNGDSGVVGLEKRDMDKNGKIGHIDFYPSNGSENASGIGITLDLLPDSAESKIEVVTVEFLGLLLDGKPIIIMDTVNIGQQEIGFKDVVRTKLDFTVNVRDDGRYELLRDDYEKLSTVRVSVGDNTAIYRLSYRQ